MSRLCKAGWMSLCSCVGRVWLWGLGERWGEGWRHHRERGNINVWSSPPTLTTLLGCLIIALALLFRISISLREIGIFKLLLIRSVITDIFCRYCCLRWVPIIIGIPMDRCYCTWERKFLFVSHRNWGPFTVYAHSGIALLFAPRDNSDFCLPGFPSHPKSILGLLQANMFIAHSGNYA